MSNIQIIKLSSGEELIGQVDDIEIEGRTLIQIQKPAVVMLIPDQREEGKFGIGLAPYAPYADKSTVSIMPNHVIAVMIPGTSLLNEYNKHYGSGVIIPDTGIKV